LMFTFLPLFGADRIFGTIKFVVLNVLKTSFVYTFTLVA
jgi:hypothetical protein